MPHTILVTVEPPFSRSCRPNRLKAIARRVLQAERLPDAEVGILITDDDTIRGLNRRYASHDEATDVLSFSLQEGEEFASPDGLLQLGEVIISFPTAQRQAELAGRLLEDEIAHLLVHGILHLLGYDHVQPEDEHHMRRREAELLGREHHTPLSSGHAAL